MLQIVGRVINDSGNNESYSWGSMKNEQLLLNGLVKDIYEDIREDKELHNYKKT